MTPQMIDAIAGLWKLVAIIAPTAAFLTCILVFRVPILGLINRATNFRVKSAGTEINISDETKRDEASGRLISQEAEDSAENGHETGSDIEVPNDSASSESLFSELIKALVTDRDLVQGEKIFQKYQESVTDPQTKQVDELLYYRLRFRAGDTSAIQSLTELASQETVAEIAYRFIGDCYADSGDHERAADAYMQASLFSGDEEQRIRNVISYAKAQHKAGGKESALNSIADEITNITSPDNVSKMFEALATLYEMDNEEELRAIALDKAIEARPNDVRLLFNAAYSYGESNRLELSLMHYETLLGFNPDSSAALNNAGIASIKLQMPIQASDYYRKSSELDSSRAAANLATLYMRAGFQNEASALLDKAKLVSDLDSSVGTAIAELSILKESETKKKAQNSESAHKQQQFLRNFAEAYLATKQAAPRFAGQWRLGSDGSIVTGREGSGNISFNSDNGILRIFGPVRNWGARISSYSVVGNLGGQGFAYMSDENNILVMTKNEEVTGFDSLVRLT